MLHYDAIIIGAGQSGTPLAIKLSKAGIKTALIEKRAVGGTCVNDGCTPTKALIASAENAYRIAHSRDWGIKVSSFSVDFDEVIQRKNRIVEQFRNSSEMTLGKSKNLTLFNGEACFTSPKEVCVKFNSSIECLQAKNIFIDAGMKPEIPSWKGLSKVPFFTSSSILDVAECPQHLLVAGGNYTGIELAQLFSRLGSKVTIVEKNRQLLPKEDPDIAAALQQILEEEGIRVYTGATVESVEGETPTLTFLQNGVQQHAEGTHLLIAIGRIPQTTALDLDKAGIDTDDKGFIIVNDRLETSAAGVFAMGDIKGGPAFTHISYNDHIVVYDNLFRGADRKYYNRQIPYCMFTDPQLGRIGLTETMATAQGIDIEVARLPMEKSSRGIETGHTKGLMKAVMEKSTGKILGAAILSAQGGEVMTVMQMAMACGFTGDQLKTHVFAHPLYAESINNLFMD